MKYLHLRSDIMCRCLECQVKRTELTRKPICPLSPSIIHDPHIALPRAAREVTRPPPLPSSLLPLTRQSRAARTARQAHLATPRRRPGAPVAAAVVADPCVSGQIARRWPVAGDGGGGGAVAVAAADVADMATQRGRARCCDTAGLAATPPHDLGRDTADALHDADDRGALHSRSAPPCRIRGRRDVRDGGS